MSLAPIDLWTTTVPTARLHPHFRSLAANPVERACLDRWAEGFADVNNNIAHEFQTKFSPAFWEIYLYRMFVSMGFAVSRPADRPDFVVKTPSGGIAVEAKVTEAGPGQPPVWMPIHEVPLDREQFYDRTCAKLSGAIASKLKHYRTYANEPAVKDKAFLLCLNPYDSPHFIMQGFEALARVLYQYCDPTLVIDKNGNMVETGHRRVESFTTKSGTVVPFGVFLNPANSELSAVYFNPRATVSKLFADPKREGHPKERVFAQWYMVTDGTLHLQEAHPSNYRETMADGGYLMLNAYAKHPIDPEPFFKQGVKICSFDADKRVLMSRTPTPFLETRITCGVVPDDFPPELMVKGKAAHSTE